MAAARVEVGDAVAGAVDMAFGKKLLRQRQSLGAGTFRCRAIMSCLPMRRAMPFCLPDTGVQLARMLRVRRQCCPDSPLDCAGVVRVGT